MIGLTLVLLPYALWYPLNHDVGWYLHLAQSVLEGQPLYTSLIETNPPLFAYLSMVPVLLESATGLPIEWIVEAIVVTLGLAMATWSGSLLSRAGAGWEEPLLPGMLCGLLVAFFVVPGPDLAQREHVMVMLATPYIIVLWRRLTGTHTATGEAVVAGLLAGVAFSLKPHFALLWIALEVPWLARIARMNPKSVRAYVRPAAITAAAVGIAYVVSVLVFHPAYLALLSAAGSTYLDFAEVRRIGLASPPYVIAVVSGLLLVLRGGNRLLELGRLYLVFAITSLLIVVLQGKGWHYHYIPAQYGIVVLAFLCVGHLLHQVRLSRLPPVRAALVVLLLASVSVVLTQEVGDSVRAGREARSQLGRWTSFFEAVPGAQSVLILSDLVSDPFPLTNRRGLEWTSPFPSLWWIQATYERTRVAPDQFETPAAIGRVEHDFARHFVRQFREQQPDFVLIDTVPKPYYGGVPFPYLAYFSQFAGFSSAWDNYVRMGTLDKFAVWRHAGAMER